VQWWRLLAMKRLRLIVGIVFIFAALCSMVFTGGTQPRGSTGFYLGGIVAFVLALVGWVMVPKARR